MPPKKTRSRLNELEDTLVESSDSDASIIASGPPAPRQAAAGTGGTVVGAVPTATVSADLNEHSNSLMSSLMETFTRMQAESNKILIETLRTLPFGPAAQVQVQPDGMTTPMQSSTRMNTTATMAFGNLAKCTARFNGSSRDPDTLEAFLDAVETYKECCNVSDEHALRGLPMLLEGDAAVWWRGVKAAIPTWSEAVSRMRSMYGTPRPAYKIFREIFAVQQREDERADVFVCRVQSQLAKLPYSLLDIVQCDITYGLLCRRVRKRVPRDSFKNLQCLIERVRDAEDTIAETQVTPIPLLSSSIQNSQPETPTTGRLSNFPPHYLQNVTVPYENSHNVLSDCKKSQKVTSASHSLTNVPSNSRIVNTDTCDSYNSTSNPVEKLYNKNSNNSKRNNNNKYCNYCKMYGHGSDDCRKLNKKSDRCYGCGQVGVIRSKCTKCSGSSHNNAKVADFNTISLYEYTTTTSHPTIEINVLGKEGVAIVDTGASHNVASASLYEIFVKNGLKFNEHNRTIRLADGSSHSKTARTAYVTITIEGRDFFTEFICFPGHDTKTLLGQSFIASAGIVLNIPHNSWAFSDKPNTRFPFISAYTINADIGNIAVMDPNLELRADEGTGLIPEQRDTLNQFLQERGPQFAASGPPTEFAVHHIKVRDNQEPIASPMYRMSPSKREALRAELDRLLDEDIIEECESPWASNVVMVSKKDGTIRLCIDYRKLNAVTEPDRYPLPRMEDILHDAKTTNFMSTLDLKSGYFQCSVSEADRDKTAFTSPLGTFRFKRMPMGLRNASATFQRLIDRFKSNLPGVCIWAYQDDMVVLSDSFGKHLADLKDIFDRLAMFNLRVNRKKSCFARDSVKFLGHVIGPKGIQVDPEKTAAIRDMAEPRNVKHLKCFLQTSSWFRRFIPNYAEIARPLTNLLKKAATWQWTEEQITAFNKLKSLLISAPILRQADESKPFVLRTDSSAYCLGAVIMQGEGHDERPIEYASRKLTDAERNYSTTEREALAVVWAVGKFRGYIEGAEIIIKTDHQPLRWLMSQRSPSGRLARWALILQEYNIRIDYTPGRANVIADTLSRPVCTQETNSDCDICLVSVTMPARSASETRNNQLKDPELNKIIKDLESDEPSRGSLWSDRGYTLSDGVLYRYDLEAGENDDACLVVPEFERAQVLADFHDAPTAGHFGVERTLARLRSRYYWPGMRNFVAQYIKHCVPCQRYKADNRKPTGLLQTPAVSRRFEVLSVDLFGPLVETAAGNKWILIVEDTCTRWVELFPLKNATSFECAKTLIDEVFFRFGVPRKVISDNGVQFISEVMQQVCHVMGIQQALTPVYHPEANPIERKNRDLKPQLAILVGSNHASWDIHMASVRFSMNSAVTASTGYSPAYLTFGRELRAPSDPLSDLRTIIESDNFVPVITPHLKTLATILADARDIHEKAQARSKKYADEGRRPPPDYKVGDLVLVKTNGSNDTAPGQTPKFIPRRDGPYSINKVLSETTYEIVGINDGHSIGKYHVSHLTPFVGSAEPPVREKRRRGRPRKH